MFTALENLSDRKILIVLSASLDLELILFTSCDFKTILLEYASCELSQEFNKLSTSLSLDNELLWAVVLFSEFNPSINLI